MVYKHTQIGYLILFILLILVLFYVWLYQIALAEVGFDYTVIFVIALVLFILTSFVTLQVSIDEKYLKLKFGYGIFKKQILLSEIFSAKCVKNHWYYGWGIRFWFWPRMLIFNVSGFDAVELKMKDGKIYRIGTDEPEKLEQAIMQAIKDAKYF